MASSAAFSASRSPSPEQRISTWALCRTPAVINPRMLFPLNSLSPTRRVTSQGELGHRPDKNLGRAHMQSAAVADSRQCRNHTETSFLTGIHRGVAHLL